MCSAENSEKFCNSACATFAIGRMCSAISTCRNAARRRVATFASRLRCSCSRAWEASVAASSVIFSDQVGAIFWMAAVM
jgi:hypothetical protein